MFQRIYCDERCQPKRSTQSERRLRNGICYRRKARTEESNLRREDDVPTDRSRKMSRRKRTPDPLSNHDEGPFTEMEDVRRRDDAPTEATDRAPIVSMDDPTNDRDNGGREQELDFRTDCAEPSCSSHCSWDFAAENDPAHREPPQHITASSKRQAFLSEAYDAHVNGAGCTNLKGSKQRIGCLAGDRRA